jgi:pre-mRNA-splicing factor ATP-dependent RNA helicase DHX38/PRP16
MIGGAGGDMDGMEHDTSDTLAAEPKRKGGLMRAGGDVSVLV